MLVSRETYVKTGVKWTQWNDGGKVQLTNLAKNTKKTTCNQNCLKTGQDLPV